MIDEKRTLGDLPGVFVKKRIYTLTFSSNNRAVLHYEELQQISGTLYRGRDKTDSFGDTSCVLYIYFEDVGYGLAQGRISEPATMTVEDFLKTVNLSLVKTPEAYIAWLDECVEAKRFINNAMISLARHIAPEKAPIYEKARLDYYAEGQRREEERKKAKEAEDAEFCREENAKADEQAAKAVEIIKSGGKLENVFLTYYRGRYDGMSCSVINHIARKYGVSIPISVQGWINRALVSVTIRDGSVLNFCHRRNSKSNTFCGYMDDVIAAVQAAETASNAA